MLVHTGVLGLVFFVAALIGILDFLVRKAIGEGRAVAIAGGDLDRSRPRW